MQSGCTLVDAYGAPGLVQELRAPLESSMGHEADVFCTSWLMNGNSHAGSGVALDGAGVFMCACVCAWRVHVHVCV